MTPGRSLTRSARPPPAARRCQRWVWSPASTSRAATRPLVLLTTSTPCTDICSANGFARLASASGGAAEPSPMADEVLITGGAGFIGSHLSDALLSAGHRVHVIDDLSTGAMENIEHLKGDPSFSYTIESCANR